MHNTNPHRNYTYLDCLPIGTYTLYSFSHTNYTIKTKGETKNIICTLAITHTHTYLPTE